MIHSVERSGKINGDGDRSLGGLGFIKTVGNCRDHGEKCGGSGSARAKTVLRLV